MTDAIVDVIRLIVVGICEDGVALLSGEAWEGGRRWVGEFGGAE